MTAKSLDSVWDRSAISHGMFRPKSFVYWDDRGEGAAGGTVRTGRIPDIDKQPRAAVYRQSRIPAIPTEPRVDRIFEADMVGLSSGRLCLGGCRRNRESQRSAARDTLFSKVSIVRNHDR